MAQSVDGFRFRVCIFCIFFFFLTQELFGYFGVGSFFIDDDPGCMD